MSLNRFGKFTISVVIDLLDFIMPPIIGTFYDAFAVWVAVKLWGNTGYAGLLEILDITDRADAFIPIVTLIGLYSEFIAKK